MTIFTADVSSNDGPVDWVAARRAGISAACVKATEGGGPRYKYTNPLFVAQHDGAIDAGIELVGAYHCLSGDDINQQINYFLQALGRGKTTLTTQRWYMLDVEPFDELDRAGALPDFTHLVSFCDYWWRNTGAPLAVYLPYWVWSKWDRPDLSGLAGAVRLVSSHYGAATPRQMTSMYELSGGDAGVGWYGYGGLDVALWQFGATCLIPGIRGGTGGADINAYRGTLNDLVALLTVSTKENPMDPNYAKNAEGYLWRLLTLQNEMPAGGLDGEPVGPVHLDAVDVLTDLKKFLAAPSAAPLALTAEDKAAIVAGVVDELRAAVRTELAAAAETVVAGLTAGSTPAAAASTAEVKSS